MSTGAKRAALGKGLEALLPSKKPAAEPVAPPPAAVPTVTIIIAVLFSAYTGKRFPPPHMTLAI